MKNSIIDLIISSQGYRNYSSDISQESSEHKLPDLFKHPIGWLLGCFCFIQWWHASNKINLVWFPYSCSLPPLPEKK